MNNWVIGYSGHLSLLVIISYDFYMGYNMASDDAKRSSHLRLGALVPLLQCLQWQSVFPSKKIEAGPCFLVTWNKWDLTVEGW